jgi:hypothetical protein
VFGRHCSIPCLHVRAGKQVDKDKNAENHQHICPYRPHTGASVLGVPSGTRLAWVAESRIPTMEAARNFICEATGEFCKGKACGPRFCEIDAVPMPSLHPRTSPPVTRRTPSRATLNHLSERKKIALEIVQCEEKERGKRFPPHIRSSRIAAFIFSGKVDAALKRRQSPSPPFGHLSRKRGRITRALSYLSSPVYGGGGSARQRRDGGGLTPGTPGRGSTGTGCTSPPL